MSWKPFDRQRAERFAQLLDEATGGRRHHIRSRVDSDLAEPLALGQRLRDIPSSPEAQTGAEVDPDFRAGLRAMLVATAEREGIGTTAADDAIVDGGAQPAGRRVGQPAFRGARTRARARGAVVIGVAAGAIAVSGMSAASENAVPGDALYGMKRHTERAQLALASSDLSRGQLFLDFARTRLAEAVAVGGQSYDFSDVLKDMDDDTRQGIKLLTSAAVQRQDPAALDAVDSFLRQQRPQLVRLFEDTTRATRSRANASLVLLDAVQTRSDELRDALACGAGATGRHDSIGPLPQACPTRRGPAGTLPDSSPSAEDDGGTRTPAEPPRDPERTSAPRLPDPTPSQEQPPPVRDGRTTAEPVHRTTG
ncbi:DUF5667 domain-containing protein [Plantactinospora sp. WMMC1484]|uniref:DUF5667 domain-containing protein n=1 Tax=Plantactinospora sp. WMMC1484 TaxID=3404122 RepID=UPI003BF4D43A